MSISFSNFLNPAWKDKIELELDTYLEENTGLNVIQSQGIYCFYETQHIGGVIFKKQGNIIWIDGLYVDPLFRRQKIGTKLLEQVNEYAQLNPVQYLQLNTYFSEARDFFQSCEFEEIANLPNWKYGLTCYFMQKAI